MLSLLLAEMGGKYRHVKFIIFFFRLFNQLISSWKIILYSGPRFSYFDILSQIKLLENYTFQSGTYPIEPIYIAVLTKAYPEGKTPLPRLPHDWFVDRHLSVSEI